MADGQDPIGFTGAESGGSLGSGKSAAHALVSDAAVGSLKTVADADVAEHIIGRFLSNHMGLTFELTSRPKDWRSPPVALRTGKKS